MGSYRESRPVWGAWIEIDTPSPPHRRAGTGRAPYGARGLKFLDVHTDTTVKAVAPRMGRVD